MEIKHYKGLNRTPAVKIALEGWHSLVSDGHCGDTICMNWDHDAFVAFDPFGKPIGVLTYSYQEWQKAILICIGYVRPDYRGMGVYTKLFAALVAKAKELKVPVIESSTFMDNAPMRAAAKHQGRKEVSVMLRYDVNLEGV